MPVAVTLSDESEGDQLSVLGIAEKILIEPRSFQHLTRKFWGVNGESRIFGGPGGRAIQVQVTIYDDSESETLYTTARELSDYIDYTLNATAVGATGALSITTDSDHSQFTDCVFEGAILDTEDSVKKDEAGMMGGGYFATVMLIFRQLGVGTPEEEEDP